VPVCLPLNFSRADDQAYRRSQINRALRAGRVERLTVAQQDPAE
jgi:hypothetical protein